MDIKTVTPFEKHPFQDGYVWLKRDDLFEFGGMRGSKARAVLTMARVHNAKGLVSAGERSSTQLIAVALVAKQLGIPCQLHVPEGAYTPEMRAAEAADAVLVRESPGYGTVLEARARDAAIRLHWCRIPYRMQDAGIVQLTANQVEGLPDVRQIVVPVGSGITLSGILLGLKDAGRSVPVTGIQMGANPSKTLDKYAPLNWRHKVKILKSQLPHDRPYIEQLDGVILDPYYEAKCVRFLMPGDCLWIAGIRHVEA